MNKRQRLADLSSRILMEAMALFIDKDNKLSFEEAKRQAAQKLATNERLKTKAPANPNMPAPSSDHSNAREELFSRIMGIKARQGEPVSIGGKIRRYIFTEPVESNEATPVEATPKPDPEFECLKRTYE